MSLSALILMGPLIYLIIKVRHKILKLGGTKSRALQLRECIWFTYGAIMKQGSPLDPSDGDLKKHFATFEIKLFKKNIYRHYKTLVCHLVDFHHHPHFLLHCQPDRISHPVAVFSALGAP